MKLELRENMNVRTKDGYISQYKYYDYNIGEGLIGKLLCIPLSNGTFANIEDIVKASYNIIDILKVGDMVNSLIVTKISEDNETKKKYINLYGSLCEWENEDIKLVITHEQMEQMAYKVVE